MAAFRAYVASDVSSTDRSEVVLVESPASKQHVQSVPEKISFPGEELHIVEFWKKIDAFNTSLKLTKSLPRFSFYDGPPFATGSPHYGHILAGTIKDIVTRYASQNGHHVPRRFGWDTHGLPIEYEIDKTLRIKGPEDVKKIGIDKYNTECRKIVTRCAGEWKATTERLGRWIDFDNGYKTLDPSYMESVWWVFKQLYEKGLVYKGVKVMPYSTACCTPLSNFEAGQNFKNTPNPSVIVSFPLDDEVVGTEVSLLVWTTTPWTLPSNLALCVHPDKYYVRIKDVETGKVYIMMEGRTCVLFKPEDFQVIDRFLGIELGEKTYTPLFSYYNDLKVKGAFRVLADTFVTDKAGTGIVHLAPYFGEDDYQVCLDAGLITRDEVTVCPVDDAGRFTDPVADFCGQHVKESDGKIIKMLKANGRVVKEKIENHSYPFCWRSDTPLIYRAVRSWFIRVERMRQQLVDNNKTTRWVPESVKENRFGNWLRDARDWTISRNRYWGTPIPIWMSEDGEEVVCVGSIDELKELSGVELTDLHREYVDLVTIPSKIEGNPPLQRIPEVFDCWFESGSMPYAQVHYPFKNRKKFNQVFPAKFVAEGIDQTRGWFYTSLVMSTALFGKAPFKNVIVNGLVLAKDGKKMSKSKKNFPDPNLIMEKYGADALRLYLINSPVVRAENLSFKEEGVKDMIKDVFIPWYNVYRFFVQNLVLFQQSRGTLSVALEHKKVLTDRSPNIMDRWIISYTESLLLFVHEEMAAYRLYTVVPRLVHFIDNLANWYVRMNRQRMKGDDGENNDCRHALQTLVTVLFSMIRIMAPFTPFLTEYMYHNLKHLLPDEECKAPDSVHFLNTPKPRMELIDSTIENVVGKMQVVIERGRNLRDRSKQPIRHVLPEVVVIVRDEKSVDELNSIQKYILEELNVRSMTVSTDYNFYGVKLRVQLDDRIGAQLKSEFNPVKAAIRKMTEKQIEKLLADGETKVLGTKVHLNEVQIRYDTTGADEKYKSQAEKDILVLLDVCPDQEMKNEGLANDVINLVQKLRKEAKLTPTDAVSVYFKVESCNNCYVSDVVNAYSNYIERAIKVPLRPLSSEKSSSSFIISKSQKLHSGNIFLGIERGFVAGWTAPSNVPADAMKVSASLGNESSQGNPSSPYVNIQLVDLEPRHGMIGNIGTILLSNPLTSEMLNYDGLKEEVGTVFGLQQRRYELVHCGVKLNDLSDISLLNGATLAVCLSVENSAVVPIEGSACSFVNVNVDGTQGSILLENPVGLESFAYQTMLDWLHLG